MKRYGVKYILGTFDIRVRGEQTERFLNILAFHQIEVLQITMESKKDGEYRGSELLIYAKDYDEVIKLSEKYHVQVEKSTRRGIMERVLFFRKRCFFLGGAFGCFLFLIMMSNCIWKIDFYGNSYYTNEVLMKYLQSRGIRYGVFKQSFSCEKEELKLRQKYQDIAWCSFSTDGCNLSVTITESVKKQSTRRQKKGMSMVAERSATIESIVTRTGTPLVKEGEKVKRNQPLVLGYLVYYNDAMEESGHKECIADADIYGVYWIDVKKKIPRKNIEERVEKIHNHIGFQGLNKDIILKPPVLSKQKKKILREYYKPPWLGKIWDGYFIKEQVFWIKEKERELSVSEARALLENQIQEECKKMAEKGIKVIEKKYNLEHNKREVVLKGKMKLGKYFRKYKKIALPDSRKGNIWD